MLDRAGRQRLLTILAVILCPLLLHAGCAGASHISPAEFKSQYQIGHMQTVMDATYLGQRDGRAYMKISSRSLIYPHKWTDEIVYVELSELDESFRAALPPTELRKP